MRKFLSAALLAAIAVQPVAAQPAQTAETAAIELKEGMTVRDTNGSRLGKVVHVYDDGSVQIINSGRFIVLPAETLSADGDNVQTSITKSEVRKMR